MGVVEIKGMGQRAIDKGRVRGGRSAAPKNLAWAVGNICGDEIIKTALCRARQPAGSPIQN
jgi:hypothetical protein